MHNLELQILIGELTQKNDDISCYYDLNKIKRNTLSTTCFFCLLFIQEDNNYVYATSRPRK